LSYQSFMPTTSKMTTMANAIIFFMSAAPSGLAGFRDGPLGICPSPTAKRS
jgi:hypothetical protein